MSTIIKFTKAIEANNFDLIKANIHKVNHSYDYNYIVEAVKYDRLEILKYFYENGFLIMESRYIYVATEHGSINVLDYMNKLGISLSAVVGGLALCTALKYRQYKMVLHLLQKGVFSTDLNDIKINNIGSVKYLNECIAAMIRQGIEVPERVFSDMYRNQVLQDLYELQKYTFKTRKVFHKKLMDQCPVSYDIIITFI